jgi:hypothetical protein
MAEHRKTNDAGEHRGKNRKKPVTHASISHGIRHLNLILIYFLARRTYDI